MHTTQTQREGNTVTLKQLAEELSVSTMTLYRRASRAGVRVQDLRGEDGELTSEGVALLASMFDSTTPTTEGATDSTTPAAHEAHTEHNEVEVARLEAEVAGLRRLVDVLEGQVADLRQRLDMAEQERRQRDQLLLPGGFRGWWRRFRGGSGSA